MSDETLTGIWLWVAFVGYIYFAIRNPKMVPGMIAGAIWVLVSGLVIMGLIRAVVN